MTGITQQMYSIMDTDSNRLESQLGYALWVVAVREGASVRTPRVRKSPRSPMPETARE